MAAARTQGGALTTAWRSSRGNPALDTGDAALLHALYAGRLLPDAQKAAFGRLEHVFPTRLIRRGITSQPLPKRGGAFPELTFVSNGKTCDLYDYVSRNRTVGLLVLKDGAIACEYHGAGHDADTRWQSMSMAKSITSLLVGCALHERMIGGIDDLVTAYLPALLGTGFNGVSIRQLLQMASGVRWNEDSTDPRSDRRNLLDLQIEQRAGAILDYMATLPREATPGSRWTYSTGETHVAGALLSAAVGMPLADYLTDRLWSRLGMDRDALWWLEAPGGLEVAGSGISATLRDFARIGLFMAQDGVVAGKRLVPEGWVALSGGCRIAAPGRGWYGLMWWPVADAAGSYDTLAFRAGGIFGQYLYVNPSEQVVIAVWSLRSKPLGADAIDDNDFFNAVVEALR